MIDIGVLITQYLTNKEGNGLDLPLKRHPTPISKAPTTYEYIYYECEVFHHLNDGGHQLQSEMKLMRNT